MLDSSLRAQRSNPDAAISGAKGLYRTYGAPTGLPRRYAPRNDGVKNAIILFDLCYAKPPVSEPAQKHDKKAPIEITSDTLEVFQAENRAVFSGHVVAIQADYRLKADQMTVHYRQQEQQGQVTADTKLDKKPADDSKNPMQAGAIQKIDTKGNVFLSTPEETASGDYGDYDVDEQVVRLNDHVVLTKGQNVLKGDRLVYNLDTGKSTVTSAAGTQSAGPDGTKQRVHALFVPEKSDKTKGNQQ